MKKYSSIFIMILVIAVFGFGNPYKQRNVKKNRLHNFDTSAVIDIEANVIEVKKSTRGKGRYGRGIELMVEYGNTKQKTLVYLGPEEYISSQNWKFNKGEKLNIKAFKGTGDSESQFFAKQITRGGEQLTLRDDNGRPMWKQSRNKGRRGKGRGGSGYGNY